MLAIMASLILRTRSSVAAVRGAFDTLFIVVSSSF
jgi:hypothetical protein